MKRLFLTAVLLGLLTGLHTNAQNVAPSNRSFAGLEKNLLFYATRHYTVTQTGPGSFNLAMLFDGKMEPSYIRDIVPTPDNPQVVTISNLPNQHIQRGAWVGWTTRLWPPKKFKIEGYTAYGADAGQWVVLADIENYTGFDFYCAVPAQSYIQIRYTFFESSTSSGLGIAELFFIHPEATAAYDKLMVQYNTAGNVGIGTTSPNHRLDVVGTVRAHEVLVNTQKGADFVFADDYKLLSLEEVERFISANKHLPDIAPAGEMVENGVSVSEFQIQLLQKIEELTLYLIDQDKKNAELNQQLQRQQKRIEELEKNR